MRTMKPVHSLVVMAVAVLSPVNLKLNPVESVISGSQAFEAGTSTVTLPGGQTDAGKYLVVLKRVGNDWKIAYDIYNSDAPPPQKK